MEMNESKKIDKKQRNKLVKCAESLHEKDRVYKRASNLDFALWLVAVLVIAFAARLFVLEPVRVVGDSMYDTLINGERMLVEKVSYWVTPPQRGDIITCYYPYHEATRVKRVIGVPGDRIAVMGGAVYLNGELLDESSYWEGFIENDMEEVIVPEDCVFVCGDNRNNSADSRSISVGPIPYYRVVGRVRGVLWPIDSIRAID